MDSGLPPAAAAGSRAVLLILDGVGAGALPDAEAYGDEGSDTLGNLARTLGGLHLPFLQSLGLGNLHEIEGVPPVDAPAASWGRMAERSAGKDSTTGHWEMMGLCSCTPFPTYPHGFPSGIISAFEAATGRRVLGNRAASGTEIIEELGVEHLRTGALIVYTSADSVFQVAAHESVVPPRELYEACQAARRLLQPPDGVGRVIARPFTGSPGSFVRTAGRRDFSLPPPGRTLLDALADAGIPRTGVGKIDDLFAHRNIETLHTPSNAVSLDTLESILREGGKGLVFANLVDFDMRWGHRNDVAGFAAGLEEVDSRLPGLTALLAERELLIIAADHGNDPTTPGTDHSREHSPLLCFSPGIPGHDLGTRSTFSDVAATLALFFGLPGGFPGTAFPEVWMP
jgi:phosphopentomutase